MSRTDANARRVLGIKIMEIRSGRQSLSRSGRGVNIGASRRPSVPTAKGDEAARQAHHWGSDAVIAL